MCRFIFVMTFFLASLFAAKAQDVIYLTNASQLEAIVEEIGDDNIRYRIYTDPYGPVFTTSIANIRYIVFENGLTQYFNNNSVSSPSSIQPMTYIKGHLYLGGERLKVRQLYKQNLPESYIPAFVSAKSFKSSGKWLIVGSGFLLASGLLYESVDIDDTNKGFWYIGCGGALLAGGTTMVIYANKRLKSIADSYNEEYGNRNKTALTLGACRSGVGLAFNF